MKASLESRIDNLLRTIDTQGGERAKLDFFLRKELLKLKAEIAGLNLPSEVIDFVARKVDSNVRDLEETSTDLIAYAVARKSPIDLDLTQRFFASRTRKKKSLRRR
ncbi:MAG: DnaA/Hda family protein [Candidatus Omnitrophica bacterium]|nr:DnaA/Hda family protein [Candidatus Omnitrophota bacterium]MCM8798419.1 DnaA/Hda family protein [Candidatus Omnitrophota bacterium]